MNGVDVEGLRSCMRLGRSLLARRFRLFSSGRIAPR